MKKLIAILLAAMLLTAAAQAEAALPGALERDAEATVDLDGDGTEERVSWTMAEAEGEFDPVLTVTVTPERGAPAVCPTEILWGEAVYLVDLDGDGQTEILLTGDVMSDDYITCCLRWMGGGLVPLLFPDAGRGENADGSYLTCGYGAITGMDGGRLTLAGSQDVLGTWFAARDYALTPLCRFEFADDGLWVRAGDFSGDDAWEYAALTLKSALPYADLDGRPAGVLSPGEKIMITASDKRTFARFVTRDGTAGTLTVSADVERGWGWLVNGVHEDDLFEAVPYAD